jgi:hypothetical protein
MIDSKHCLVAGGVITALISLLHVVLALTPGLYRIVAPGQESPLAQMAIQGASQTTLATAALALVFAIWALYAFSGAGLIGRLPLLRGVLIVIGALYVLRSLALISEIDMVLNHDYPLRFAGYSIVSLIAGLLYLIGILGQRASSTSGS